MHVEMAVAVFRSAPVRVLGRQHRQRKKAEREGERKNGRLHGLILDQSQASGKAVVGWPRAGRKHARRATARRAFWEWLLLMWLIFVRLDVSAVERGRI